MIPFNKYNKLRMAKLLIILKILEKSNFNEDINIVFKRRSKNIKHKNIATSSNLSVKKNKKDKIYTECILPMQEVNIEEDTKDIPPIVDLHVEDYSECIQKEDEINNTTANNIYEPPENLDTNHSENFISTLPIIIAEKNIDIPIESTFKLKNSALEIKNMKNELYLTNSTLLPMYEEHDISSPFYGKLFLEGFVRNKLDFSIAKSISDNLINLDTECVIVYIPFKCTSLIQYRVPPVFSKEKTPDYIPLYMSCNCIDFNSDYNECHSNENPESTEYINCKTPPIACEIKEYKISETYSLLDKTPFNKNFPIEINFNTIKENIIINLSLTLLQEQDVSLNYKRNVK